MELNEAWMTETNNSFHADSSLYHTSSTVLAGEEWRVSLSAAHDQIFSMGDRSGDHASQVNSRIPCVSRGRSEHDAKHTVLHYLVEDDV
ncbi:hypothetical protein TNCV_5077041 [Trichonephila clavipes]|uniref:Uncharacterized protein n=1 Tax=Trichonephila clavipes TaxID=2585209 RepID=A0A8X6V1N3_TRICX|nr:hypothetical protein TNCV_5077041 [Trichonephila clavipes]